MNLTGKQYGIIIATLVTGLLHLFLLTRLGLDPIALNGFGYLALLGAYFLPIPLFQQRHRLVWWVFIGYTLLTFVLWIFLREPKPFVPDFSNATIGYYAKTAELFLIGFLLADRPKA